MGSRSQRAVALSWVNLSPEGANMIIPFLIWSILIIVPVTLIAWWGVREDK